MEKEIILEKIEYLKENLIKLKIRNEKYLKEKNEETKETLMLAISKLVEEIVESAIKINNIILKNNKDFASNYYETFSKLSKYYNLEKEFLLNIAKTTSFRNKITHEYKEMEYKIIKEIPSILILYKKYIDFIVKEIL